MSSALRSVWLFLIVAAGLSAAEIHGRVVDAATGEPVINANVIVEKLNTGAATDLEGNFTITDLPQGNLTLFISHIAYQDQKISVLSNRSTPLKIELTETFFQLSEVVVTGTRTEKIHQNVPVTTEVISRKDIDDSGTLDLGELLNQRAGVAVTSSVEGGSVVNLMGIDSRYILILVDGQPITGKFNERVSLEQIPTSIIEKVEIIKGPNSSLYGSEAMGGVINVITSKNIQDLQGSVRVRYSGDMGVYPDKDGNDTFYPPTNGPRTNIQANLGLGTEKIDGRINTDYTFARPNDVAPHISVDRQNRTSLGIELSYKPLVKLKTHSKYDLYHSSEKSFGDAMNYYTTVHRNNLLGDVSLKPNNFIELQVVGRYADYYRHYDQIRPWNEGTNDYEGQDTTRAAEQEIELIGIYSASTATINIGAEFGTSDYAGERLAGGTRSINSTSFYGQAEFSPLDAVTFVIGTRWDDTDEISPVLSPRVAAMWALDQRWKLRGAMGFGYRQPSFMERYIDWFHSGVGYAIIGNPDLKPERSFGINLGLEYYHPGAYQVSLMLYLTEFRDMIDDYIYTGEDNPYSVTAFSYRNINRVRYTGLEFQNRWKVSQQWLASWGYNFVDNRNVETGALIANTQPHTANLRVSYQTRKGNLASSIKAKLVGPYYPEDYNTETEEFERAATKRKPFAMVDVDTKYSLNSHLKIGGGCQNLLDYMDERYGPFIGRRVYFELIAELN